MIFLAAALWLCALYDGPSPHLADDLRAAAMDHILVLPGRDATELPGVATVRAKPQSWRTLRGAGDGAVVTNDGVWPGLHSNIVLNQQRDIGFAAATAEPWIDSNGWLLLYAHGVAPGTPVVLTHAPPEGVLPKIGADALALGEAAVFGGSFAVPASALADGSTPRARANRRRTLAQSKFIADHAGWFSAPHETAVSVLVDDVAPVEEVMNMLVRRNLPFRAFTRDHFPTERPPAVVLVGQPALPGPARAKLDAWRSAGTTVIERASVDDPSAFAAEVRTALGDRRPFRLTNGQQVIGALTRGPERVLHLLNYGIDPIQDVRVQLADPPARATLFAPGEEPRVLEIRQGEIAIPEMGTYCALLLGPR